MFKNAVVTALVAGAFAATVCAGEIVFENARVRAVLGDDAIWRSVVDKASGKDYCAQNQRVIFAAALVGDAPKPRAAGADGNVIEQQAMLAKAGSAQKMRQAKRAVFADSKLTIGFASCDTVLTYDVKSEPDWILFTLVGVSGTRPSELTLLRVATTVTERVGTRLGIGWNETFAIGLMSANLQTRGQAIRRKDYTELLAATQDAPGPKLEGAAAALVAAPTAEIDAILQRFSVACNLPRDESDGVPSKRLPIARQSYWFLGFGEQDVEKVIEYCRQSGFKQVMLMSGSWCSVPGHYVFNKKNYPDGVESLKRTVEKLHAAGILVGMHCFASKVAKIDAYVTPVPDQRFWTDRQCELAGDVSATDTTIRAASDLREWPGSPVASQKTWEGGVTKHQEVILNDEIVAFERIGPEGKWDTFEGCKRGAFSTTPAAHKAKTVGRHYGVDGCINGYIIDQETTLLDETTTRLADIFNACGFDMVYFDGGEDVDRRRFDYYVSKFQAVTMSKFTKRPLVHMGTIMTHHLWHSFTRSGTVDTYLNTLNGAIIAGAKVDQWPTVRQHIDTSVSYMLSIGDDRMPGELGWFGIWPKGKNTDGLQLDEMEYLMCKSLAYDAPVSLETSFRQMESHPLTSGILEIARAYEELRTAGAIDAATRAKLREPRKDFLLFRGQPGGKAEFIEVTPAEVAGGREVRALLGARGGDMIMTLWHYTGQAGSLLLGGVPKGTRLVDTAGVALPADAAATGNLPILLGPSLRAVVVLPDTTLDDARELLKRAILEEPRPPKP